MRGISQVIWKAQAVRRIVSDVCGVSMLAVPCLCSSGTVLETSYELLVQEPRNPDEQSLLLPRRAVAGGVHEMPSKQRSDCEDLGIIALCDACENGFHNLSGRA